MTGRARSAPSIGGTPLARNVISANAKAGITIELTNGTNNKIQGNFIGTLANGVTPAGNLLHGVLIFNGARQSNRRHDRPARAT